MNPLINQEELDDIFADIRQTCDDCQHPRCLSILKSVKSLLSAQQRALLDEFEKIIGEDEKAYLYGSKEQMAMDDGEEFENDLAICRNYYRSEQRTKLKELREGL